MHKVLLVEDDQRVASFLKNGLTEKLFSVVSVDRGYEAIQLANQSDFDVIILDVMLPDTDGFEVCKAIRKRHISVPVLMLSALNSPEEKTHGLDCGADDYLGKPFHFPELLARINAQLRRKAFEKGNFEDYSFHDLKVDVDRHQVHRGATEITLSPREFKLLLYLLKNRGKVVSRAEIADAVWDIQFDTNTNIVDVYINYLRNKIDKGFSPTLIQTIKGRGYLLEARHES
ncbi:response regulator transcription factor [Larkinella harenae]